MYKVIHSFYDLRSHHEYAVGDIFPHSGSEVEAKRIAELEGFDNKLGKPLIKKIAAKPKKSKKAKE